MKKLYGVILVAFILCGCRNTDEQFDRAMHLRADLLNANGCKFTVSIIADFSEQIYTFVLDCETDSDGNLQFSVVQPDYIAGISGQIADHGGELIFDDVALAFPLQNDEYLSPVCGPWVLLRALRSGYVRYCGLEDGLLRITLDDSFEDDALRLDVWIDGEGKPIQADIFQNNQRILILHLEDYQLL